MQCIVSKQSRVVANQSRKSLRRYRAEYVHGKAVKNFMHALNILCLNFILLFEPLTA